MTWSVRGAVGGILVAAGAATALAQEGGRLDLSGTWRVSPSNAAAGAVSLSGRSPGATADRYTLRFERRGAASQELAVAFDGRTLRPAPPEATSVAAGVARSEPSRGFAVALEEREGPGAAATGGSPGAAPAVRDAPAVGSWELDTVPGARSRPGLSRFRGTPPAGFPATFARLALELVIDGGEGDRLGVGTDAAFEGSVSPAVDGTFAWSATPAEALEQQPSGKWLVVRGKRGGKVTLELAFTSKALGDVVRTTRVVEVRPGVERIEITGISYLTDHGLLRDNDRDWGSNGKAIPQPEWTPARQGPISHTMGQRVGIRVALSLGPANAIAGGKVKLVGDGPGELDFEGELVLEPGKATVELTSRGALEKKVQQLDLAVAWSVVGSETTRVVPEKTATTTWVTFDAPLEAGNSLERGITVKRMAKAVESVGAAGSLDPHAIARAVMSKWKRFNLDVAYTNAWRLGDELTDPTTGKLVGADCQTIVRYTRALIKQVGVPGQADWVVVYAKCTDPTVGIESLDARNHMGRPRQYHNDFFPADPARDRWSAFLIDGDGRPNNYEAALRFEHGGKKKYYPGGVDAVMDTPSQVVGVFTTMSWYDGKVRDAIHNYR